VTGQELLAYISDEPQTANAIYRQMIGVPMRIALSTHRRKSRRQAARILEILAMRGEIERVVVNEHDEESVTWVGFKRK
jgi:hypothetical protein